MYMEYTSFIMILQASVFSQDSGYHTDDDIDDDDFNSEEIIWMPCVG